MSRCMTLKSNKKGTLLLEVLLTVSIMAVGLTAIIYSYLSSFRACAYTADYSLAAILLESKMNDLLYRRFIEDSRSEDGIFPDPYQRFRYHLSTRNLNQDGKLGDLNEATLGIAWDSGRRKNNIVLTTYLFNLPK